MPKTAMLIVYPQDLNSKPTRFDEVDVEQFPLPENNNVMKATFTEEDPKTNIRMKKRLIHNLAFMYVETTGRV